jgi:CheY-like chemotaxis protein
VARIVRVLIVEDDPAIQNAYEFVLQKSGFEVYTADNGQEALAQLVHVPDIILLDMLMPGYSGLDFLREAELPERYPRIQVVAVSNIDSPRVKEDAKNYGVVRYVLKVEMTPRDIARMVTELAAEQKPVRSDVPVD